GAGTADPRSPAPTGRPRAPPRVPAAGGDGRPSAEDVLHLAEEGPVLLLLLGRGQGLGELVDHLALLGGEARGDDDAHGTWRSPRPRPPRWGTPWLRIRNVVPLCVPSGMESFEVPPSAVGTSSEPPSAACAKPMGTSQSSADPSRWKNGCSSTRTTTYRSPGG